MIHLALNRVRVCADLQRSAAICKPRHMVGRHITFAKAQDLAALEAMRARDIATWDLDAAQRNVLAAGHTVETHFSVNDFQQPKFAGSPEAKHICRAAANQHRERSNSPAALPLAPAATIQPREERRNDENVEEMPLVRTVPPAGPGKQPPILRVFREHRFHLCCGTQQPAANVAPPCHVGPRGMAAFWRGVGASPRLCCRCPNLRRLTGHRAPALRPLQRR